MKALSPALQAHLDDGTTTLSWCWRISRTDGVALGFTDHDRALSFDGTGFEPESGFAASEIRAGSDLSVDAQDATGVLTSDRITETDILDGRWDNAAVELWRVNWADTSQRVLLRRGAVGQIRRGRMAFVAEVRSLAHVLGQTVGRTFQAGCDAALGDARCGIDLENAIHKGTGAVTDLLRDRAFMASGLSGFEAGWFTSGTLTWNSGANAGRVAAEQTFVVWNGTSWDLVGEPVDVSDAVFSLVNDADPTRKALFSLSGITTGTTRTFALPNTSSELAILAGTQTFTGNKTFSGSLTASGAVSITGTLAASGTVTVSAAAASIGTAITAATYGMGTGINPTGVSKTLNLGTGGAAGSTTVVNIGSATAGAGGTTVVNTPTVTFANAVTQVGMPQANLTAQLLGLGGATADATNRLSVNTPNVLLNNAGASIDVTVNKNAAANDASFSFKTGFSVRALFGTLGSDDFTLKVSPNGSSFFDALVADRNTGRVRFPVGVALTGLAADPGSPTDGWLWHNSTTGQLRARLGGVTRVLADQDVPWIAPAAGDYALTTSGAGGAATGVLAGAAGRIDLFPFIPRDDITVDRLSVNVTTLIAAALGKIVLYAADATGRPATLMLETGDLDFSTVGLKEATIAQTLRRGITYWIGIRHSSTAILSAWASTATPDLNGGAPVTTARKVLRRTLAYATATPGTWGYLASETNAGPGTAVWLRAA